MQMVKPSGASRLKRVTNKCRWIPTTKRRRTSDKPQIVGAWGSYGKGNPDCRSSAIDMAGDKGGDTSGEGVDGA